VIGLSEIPGFGISENGWDLRSAICSSYITAVDVFILVDVGTEEMRKSSSSVAPHEMADSRAPRRDLPTLPQNLVRSVPHKRMSFSTVFRWTFLSLFICKMFF